ncbi:MAG: SDR family oxidoreductase [Deltaproteobacteria bacterium]|nr:SDR family oxidoreductase [Deltaproteobacteria bacterium]
MNNAEDKTIGLLDGRVAIVTGGSIGIGLSTAAALAREDAYVVLVGRNRARLDKALLEIKQKTGSRKNIGLELDVRRESDMEQMARQTLDHFGRIDILVAAAGILRARGGRLRTLQQMSLEEWDEVIDTNLKGLFLSNRAVIPTMIRQRSGNIVNLSSTSGRKGLAFDSAYCASKFGSIGLSEAISEELRQYGIRVQVLLPGAIDTGMWDQNGPIPPPKDILTPDRVADFILYMITLSEDTVLDSPIVEPLKRHAPIWIEQRLTGNTNVVLDDG